MAPGARPPDRCLHIVQGEQMIVTDPSTVLSTLLGSCVAACMRDPVAGVGGMNHFLLPGDAAGAGGARDGAGIRYGVHLMELLVNGLLRRGARRSRIEAKLFGGARMRKGLTDVGEQNVRFAEGFLKAEGIALVGGSLRGDRGRRIQYWPATGRARQIMLKPNDNDLAELERAPAPPAPAASGTLELF